MASDKWASRKRPRLSFESFCTICGRPCESSTEAGECYRGHLKARLVCTEPDCDRDGTVIVNGKRFCDDCGASESMKKIVESNKEASYNGPEVMERVREGLRQDDRLFDFLQDTSETTLDIQQKQARLLKLMAQVMELQTEIEACKIQVRERFVELVQTYVGGAEHE